MKISWAYKILVVYLAFVLGIMFLVFKANSERYDLVTDNYYEAEVKYQDVIDQKQRVANLSTPPEISYDGHQLRIQFPADFTGKILQGELYLYRPSDEQKRLPAVLYGIRQPVFCPVARHRLRPLRHQAKLAGRRPNLFFGKEKVLLSH